MLAANQSFAFLAPMSMMQEARIIYPSYPSLTPTTYDGNWDYFFDVPGAQRKISMWDGDFDFGNYVGDTLDTDDRDSPNSVPSFATGTSAVAEGVAVGDTSGGVRRTGFPADDNQRYSPFLRTPSIVYDILTPTGLTFTNSNPSGNREWERFTISTATYNRDSMDFHADTLANGTYHVTLRGADLSNLNAWRFSYDLLGINGSGDPVDNQPPSDTVTVSPSTCWPPRHTMLTVTAHPSATDNSGGTPTYTLVSVTSNEPDNGQGDGDTPNDIQGVSIGTNDTVFSLRCERGGRGDGRIYTIVYRFDDGNGNTSYDTAYFSVPHDAGRNKEATYGPGDDEGLTISAALPNPFTTSTSIQYSIAKPGSVDVSVYTPDGRLVRTLERTFREAGSYTSVWDGRDDRGNRVATGAYIAHVGVGECACGKTIEVILAKASGK
jgi:hypothetical protein